MRLQAQLLAPNASRAYQAAPATAEQLADQFGKEMMKNLRRNVSEQKKRRAAQVGAL